MYLNTESWNLNRLFWLFLEQKVSMVCKSDCVFQKFLFFLLLLSLLVCVCWQLFLFHVFLPPCTKWEKSILYVYNPVGFPSSKPAINPNHCYFFLQKALFTPCVVEAAQHIPFSLSAASPALPEHTGMIKTT